MQIVRLFLVGLLAIVRIPTPQGFKETENNLTPNKHFHLKHRSPTLYPTVSPVYATPSPTYTPTFSPTLGSEHMCSWGLTMIMTDPRLTGDEEKVNLLISLIGTDINATAMHYYQSGMIGVGLLKGFTTLVLVEQEVSSFLPEEPSFTDKLSEDDRKALRAFQAEGNTIVVIGSNRFHAGRDVQFINEVFGLNVQHSEIACEDGAIPYASLSSATSDTPWEYLPPTLPYANAVYCLRNTSLPENSQVIYADEHGHVWAARMLDGGIFFLAFDFYQSTNIELWTYLLLRGLASADGTCKYPPTQSPTAAPSHGPSILPSASPTVDPSVNPSANPTVIPTALPTENPSAEPSVYPTAVPTAHPSESPSADPSATPTAVPTAHPSASPSAKPSAVPTTTNPPSAAPSNVPTYSPSHTPTLFPTMIPSVHPTRTDLPTHKPTATAPPSGEPTAEPTGPPSQSPSAEPTALPTDTTSPTNFPTRGNLTPWIKADIGIKVQRSGSISELDDTMERLLEEGVKRMVLENGGAGVTTVSLTRMAYEPFVSPDLAPPEHMEGSVMEKKRIYAEPSKLLTTSSPLRGSSIDINPTQEAPEQSQTRGDALTVRESANDENSTTTIPVLQEYINFVFHVQTDVDDQQAGVEILARVSKELMSEEGVQQLANEIQTATNVTGDSWQIVVEEITNKTFGYRSDTGETTVVPSDCGCPETETEATYLASLVFVSVLCAGLLCMVIYQCYRDRETNQMNQQSPPPKLSSHQDQAKKQTVTRSAATVAPVGKKDAWASSPKYVGINLSLKK